MNDDLGVNYDSSTQRTRVLRIPLHASHTLLSPDSNAYRRSTLKIILLFVPVAFNSQLGRTTMEYWYYSECSEKDCDENGWTWMIVGKADEITVGEQGKMECREGHGDMVVKKDMWQ